MQELNITQSISDLQFFDFNLNPASQFIRKDTWLICSKDELQDFLLSVQLMLCFVVLSVDREEVDSGVGSVQLPCKTTLHLAEDAKVEWMDSGDHRVHVFQNGLDQPVEQSKDYRGRTEMYANLVKTGDLSLFLDRPTEKDTNIYTCTVHSREGNILLMKQVKLYVRGQCCRYILISESSVMSRDGQ